MNTHQLEIFYHVAKFQSISKAAEALYISQPAVSSQIKKLESAYGVHLIEKNGQGIQLTALGIQLYEIIRSFFENAIVSAESLLKNSSVLRISGNFLMTNFVIPQIFDHETNQANLIIKSTSSFNALTELKNGYCDLALISASSQPVLSADISVKKIFDDEIISVSKNPLESEVTSLIVSKSKIDVYKILEKNNPLFSHLPYTAVESTQDALSNININKNSATFISARFLKYFEKDYNYHYTGVKNGFYALYKSNNFHTDEIIKLIEMIKSSTK
ncbi:LysR family transcriptional regulator [Lactococcus lactis]|uniref:LysR family transcriptional regulator n=1 Tax=Lactococcus lactis TaxID=1358 RepID=UPI0015D5059B|nr:LysR family transcriptional regulator [Lactococcus lactis]GFO79233.1 LysR family transcriptional regulator [Lactococcus lactis]